MTTFLYTVTTLGIYMFLIPCSYVLNKIKKARKVQREKSKKAKKRSDPNHSYDFLMKTMPYDLVWYAALFAYLRLLLDCFSWTYYITFWVEGWLISIVDGVSTFTAVISVSLMVIVFIHRCYITFVGSASQHAPGTYTAMFCGVSCIFISGSVMAGAVSYWRWRLTAVSSAIFTSSLLITTIFSTYFFVSPLYQLAQQSKQNKLTHVCARFLLLTMMSLVSSSVTYGVAAVGYWICDECLIVFAYYNLVTIDALVNLTALWFTIDSDAYYSTFQKWHGYTVLLFDKKKLYGNGIPLKKNGQVGEQTATMKSVGSLSAGSINSMGSVGSEKSANSMGSITPQPVDESQKIPSTYEASAQSSRMTALTVTAPSSPVGSM